MAAEEDNSDLERRLIEERIMSSGRRSFDRASTRSVSKHVFRVYNYKKPTFCAHCDNLLVGVIRQGMRCKRCELDIHESCQKDLNKDCIEVIVGNHNFVLKTYKQLTYCDYCEKLLVGVVYQGLRCSECKANVHERCQELIEVSCEKVQRRLTARRTSAGASDKRKNSKPGEKVARPTIMGAVVEGKEETDHSQLFAVMPKHEASKEAEQVRSNSLGPQAEVLKHQVEEVTKIISKNVTKMNERGEKIDNLQNQSEILKESSKIFQTSAKEIKKKYWFENKKMCIGITVAVLIVILIIVIIVVIETQNTSGASSPSATANPGTT